MKADSQAAHGGNPWLPEDDNQIEDAVRNGLNLQAICAMFPSRSSEAVRHRIMRARRNIQSETSQLNVQTSQTVGPQTAIRYSKGGHPWTTEELESLDGAILNGSDLARIRAMFPGRSADAVRLRYNKNLQQLNLQAEEIPTFAQMEDPQAAEKQEANRTSKNAALWTREDDQKVANALRANIGRDEIRKMFPKRSNDAVQTRIRKITKLLRDQDSSAPSPVGDDQQSQLEQSDTESVRSFNTAEFDRDYVIGQTSAHDEYMMSGALPVSSEKMKVVHSADQPQDSQNARSPPLRAQEYPTTAFWEFPFGNAPHEPYPEGSDEINNQSWYFNAVKDTDMLLPETRAFLEGLPDNENAGRPSQEKHYPTLPLGSIDNVPLDAFASTNEQYMHGSSPFDTGFSQYTLSTDDHPDLLNGFDFAPTPHHPVTPSGFVTSEELFSDSSMLAPMLADDTPFIPDEQLVAVFGSTPPIREEDKMEE